ncbi:MAG: hypothetical protein OEW58_12065 [Gammaproteobacteria bacterium]|nr:hypothetical protein [Gammaproteobacteria bacterium]
MLMLDFRDFAWWYWLVSTISLWFTLTTTPEAYSLTIAIGGLQLLHFALREQSLRSFPVQIRLGYLSVLLIAMPDGFQWVLWIPAVGTLIRVLIGYCIMARILMLMPFNRQNPLSLRFVKDAFLTQPVRGNILHGLALTQTR